MAGDGFQLVDTRGGAPAAPAPFRFSAAWRKAVCVLALLALVGAGKLREVPTKYYLIRTDLEPAFAADLGKRMDAMHEEYARRMAEFKPDATPEKLEVLLYDDESGYTQLTGGKVPNTAGIFMAGRENRLAAYLGEQERDALRRTLQHEAFHQFAYTTIATNLPIWLNEGMAQLFEEGIWSSDGRFTIGEVPPWRVRQLRDDIKSKRLTSFDKLFALTNQGWAANVVKDAETGATQYNQAWAMAQFLAWGTSENKRNLLAWLRAMHAGEDANASYRRIFKKTPAELEAEFNDWAKRLAATELAMMIEHQKILADMLISHKGKGTTFRDMFDFRKRTVTMGYRIQYTRGRVKWTTHRDPGIYFSDLNGKALSPDRLYFDVSTKAPLPDMVCVCSDGVVLRTRFYNAKGGKIQNEIVMERGRGK